MSQNSICDFGQVLGQILGQKMSIELHPRPGIKIRTINAVAANPRAALALILVLVHILHHLSSAIYVAKATCSM